MPQGLTKNLNLLRLLLGGILGDHELPSDLGVAFVPGPGLRGHVVPVGDHFPLGVRQLL